MKSIRLIVSGKVQGVWYRASAQQKAKTLGVYGFVKNLADGRVFIEVEGSDTEVDLFVDWCREGPHLARVNHLEKEEIPPQSFTDFTIQK